MTQMEATPESAMMILIRNIGCRLWLKGRTSLATANPDVIAA